MPEPQEFLIVFAAGASGLALVVLRLRPLAAYRRLQDRLALKRTVSSFPRLSSWARGRRELQLRMTPRGPLYDLRVLRLRLTNALEAAGAASFVLLRMNRVDTPLALMIRRLRDLGFSLDRRLVAIAALRDPVLVARDISAAAHSISEVEAMASALNSLAASCASGTIDLEAAALRRELESEVAALHAGLRREVELASPDWAPAAPRVSG